VHENKSLRFPAARVSKRLFLDYTEHAGKATPVFVGQRGVPDATRLPIAGQVNLVVAEECRDAETAHVEIFLLLTNANQSARRASFCWAVFYLIGSGGPYFLCVSGEAQMWPR
jgi:hypothetical protein